MIYRSKFKNIIFEFVIPGSVQKGIILLLNGMPAVPKQNELLNGLSAAGYVVIFPRYSGTWESSGKLFEKSPVTEVQELCKHILSEKTLIESYGEKTFKLKTEKIIAVGSSFGGAIALALAPFDFVKKVVALSPVIDWRSYAGEKTKADMAHLRKFVKEGFGEGYRFTESGWSKFAAGKLFNAPTQLLKNISKKVIIVYDKADATTLPEPIKKYADQESIILKEVKGFGHISFSRFPVPKLLKYIK